MTLFDALTSDPYSELQIEDLYDFQVEGETIEWYYDRNDATSNVGASLSAWYEDAISVYIDYADSIVDLDFVRTFDNSKSDLDFYVDEYNPYNSGILGLFTNYTEWGEIDLFFDLNASTSSTMNTILHETGHYLGLGEIGFDFRWDQLDSAMSYNSSSTLDGGYQLFFTSNDIDALVSLHGSEDDHIINWSEAALAPDPDPTDTSVHRFYNSNSGVHLYTDSDLEAVTIHENPSWGYTYEGVAYEALEEGEGTELFRFFHSERGYHFLTADENEARVVQGADWGYDFEGMAYEVSLGSTPETPDPVHRFYREDLGTHFYTADTNEMNHIINNNPNYQYEQVAWYV